MEFTQEDINELIIKSEEARLKFKKHATKKYCYLFSLCYAVGIIFAIAFVCALVDFFMAGLPQAFIGFFKHVIFVSFLYALIIGLPLSLIIFILLWGYYKKTFKQKISDLDEFENEQKKIFFKKMEVDKEEREKLEHEKHKKMLEEAERLEKQQEQEEWQKQLDREIERERRLAEVRHESTLMAMQAQIKLYGEYKEKGLDIEKQIFDMRKNLIELEGQENKAMLDEVRQALDELDT
jgi:membrane protein implicated in regulation of membrane protease activity